MSLRRVCAGGLSGTPGSVNRNGLLHHHSISTFSVRVAGACDALPGGNSKHKSDINGKRPSACVLGGAGREAPPPVVSVGMHCANRKLV